VIQRALLLSRARQCGLDTAKASTSEVEAVATMDRPPNYEHLDLGEGAPYNASTFTLHGLPYDYASFHTENLPTCCPTCNATLTNPLRPETKHLRMFAGQTHLGICGGDGRCLHAHEIAKLSIKRLALSNPDPGGIAILSNLLLIEPRHLRSDNSRPSDLYGMEGGRQAKDAAMDVMVSSTISNSTLLQSSKKSNFVLHQAENIKFTKDLRNVDPLQLSATQRFIP